MMPPKRQHLLPLAAALAILPLAVFGQTSIFNDDFGDGARSGVSNTTGLTWFGPGSSNPSITTGAMTLVNSSGGSRALVAYFAPTDNRVELANVGDSLTLTAVFSVAAT